MSFLDTIINYYVKKRLPAGFEKTETLSMALTSARKRLEQESTELLQDLLLVVETEKKHNGNEDRAK